MADATRKTSSSTTSRSNSTTRTKTPASQAQTRARQSSVARSEVTARSARPSNSPSTTRPKSSPASPKADGIRTSTEAQERETGTTRSAGERQQFHSALAGLYGDQNPNTTTLANPGPRPASSQATQPVAAAAATPAAEPAAPATPPAPVSAPATPSVDQPADLSEMANRGDIDYYKTRLEDFKRRNPGVEPPDYYMDYGDKYARRFTNELSPKLGPDGQKWLADARRNLQVAIENKRKEDPAAFAELERNPEKFKEFAYGTHADAYLDAGLKKLNPLELAQVGLTPDAKDLLTSDGLSQVLDTGSRLAGQWAQDAGDYVADKTAPIVKPVVEAGQWVADKAAPVVAPVVEKAKEAGDWVADKAAPVVEKAKEAGEWVVDKATPVVAPVVEKAKEAGQWVADKAAPVVETAKEAGQWALETSMPAIEATKNGVQWGVDKVAEGAKVVSAGTDYVADQASRAWNNVTSFFSW